MNHIDIKRTRRRAGDLLVVHQFRHVVFRAAVYRSDRLWKGVYVFWCVGTGEYGAGCAFDDLGEEVA